MSALASRSLERLIPGDAGRAEINRAIFEELCRGEFHEDTTGKFLDEIESLKGRGADRVILGCTEIPLIVTSANS